MGKGKAKQKQRGTIDRQNFSDASIQLFHPAHDGKYASSFLILSVGDERLAFNCGEGFQRLCAECKVCHAPWPCPYTGAMPIQILHSSLHLYYISPVQMANIALILKLVKPRAGKTIPPHCNPPDTHTFPNVHRSTRGSDHLRRGSEKQLQLSARGGP